MLYAITLSRIDDSATWRQAQTQHRQRLHDLREGGRLILAGALPGVDSPDPGDAGFRGTLLVAEFDSLDSAWVWARRDPLLAGDTHLQVRPFLAWQP